MPLRLQAVPTREHVAVLEPVELRVRLVNDSAERFSAEHHFLLHAPFENHVWWKARLPDGRFVTNHPMTSLTCPGYAGHELEMGSMTIPPHGVIEFDFFAMNGLQIEPEPPDWVIIGASATAGIVEVVLKDGIFALEARARVKVT